MKLSAVRSIMIILLMCIFCTQENLYAVTEIMESAGIQISAANRDDARNLGRFAVICSNMVDGVLGSEKEHRKMLYIRELTEDAPVSGEYSVVYDPSAEIHEFTFNLIHTILRRCSREHFKQTAVDNTVLDFLASALTFRRLTAVTAAGGDGLNMDYRPAKAQFDNGFFPDAKKLLSSPVSLEFPSLFQMYSMHCELLLRCLESIPVPKGQIVMKLLEMAAFGRTPEQAADFAIGSHLPQGMAIQGWYERMAAIIINRGNTAKLNEAIETKIRALESVRVVNPNSGDSFSYVNIEDAPSVFNDLRTDKAAMRRRQIQFLELKKEASLLYHPALEAFARSLGHLADNNVKMFRFEIDDARKKLAEASRRQREAAASLDKAEKDSLSLEQRYRREFEVRRHFREIREAISPLGSMN